VSVEKSIVKRSPIFGEGGIPEVGIHYDSGRRTSYDARGERKVFIVAGHEGKGKLLSL